MFFSQAADMQLDLRLERPKHAIPIDQPSGVIAVEILQIGGVVYAMVIRRVSEFRYKLGVSAQIKPDTGYSLHTHYPVTVASFRTWRGWRGCVA